MDSHFCHPLLRSQALGVPAGDDGVVLIPLMSKRLSDSKADIATARRSACLDWSREVVSGTNAVYQIEVARIEIANTCIAKLFNEMHI